jgi:hypothetical protein
VLHARRPKHKQLQVRHRMLLIDSQGFFCDSTGKFSPAQPLAGKLHAITMGRKSL